MRDGRPSSSPFITPFALQVPRCQHLENCLATPPVYHRHLCLILCLRYYRPPLPFTKLLSTGAARALFSHTAIALIPRGYNQSWRQLAYFFKTRNIIFKADIPSANIVPFRISRTTGFYPVKHPLAKHTLTPIDGRPTHR